MSEQPTVDDLDALSTDELRHRAFDLAERKRDVGFFWDLLKHLRQTADIATEDGSSGNITGGLAEAVEAARELATGDLGDNEPLIRARFVDYVMRGE